MADKPSELSMPPIRIEVNEYFPPDAVMLITPRMQCEMAELVVDRIFMGDTAEESEKKLEKLAQHAIKTRGVAIMHFGPDEE